MLKLNSRSTRAAFSDADFLFHLAEVAQMAHAEGDLVTADAFIALAYSIADVRYDDAAILQDAA